MILLQLDDYFNIPSPKLINTQSALLIYTLTFKTNQLFKSIKILGDHPLHVAVRLMREDVVFLCLVENDQSVSVNHFINSSWAAFSSFT